MERCDEHGFGSQATEWFSQVPDVHRGGGKDESSVPRRHFIAPRPKYGRNIKVPLGRSQQNAVEPHRSVGRLRSRDKTDAIRLESYSIRRRTPVSDSVDTRMGGVEPVSDRVLPDGGHGELAKSSSGGMAQYYLFNGHLRRNDRCERRLPEHPVSISVPYAKPYRCRRDYPGRTNKKALPGTEVAPRRRLHRARDPESVLPRKDGGSREESNEAGRRKERKHEGRREPLTYTTTRGKQGLTVGEEIDRRGDHRNQLGIRHGTEEGGCGGLPGGDDQPTIPEGGGEGESVFSTTHGASFQQSTNVNVTQGDGEADAEFWRNSLSPTTESILSCGTPADSLRSGHEMAQSSDVQESGGWNDSGDNEALTHLPLTGVGECPYCLRMDGLDCECEKNRECRKCGFVVPFCSCTLPVSQEKERDYTVKSVFDD